MTCQGLAQKRQAVDQVALASRGVDAGRLIYPAGTGLKSEFLHQYRQDASETAKPTFRPRLGLMVRPEKTRCLCFENSHEETWAKKIVFPAGPGSSE